MDLALQTTRLGAGWLAAVWSHRGSRMSKPTRTELALVALSWAVLAFAVGAFIVRFT